MTGSTATFMRVLALAGGVLLCSPGPSLAAAAQLPTVGWIERVKLGADGVLVAAKLDTGADTSSLHAENIRWEKRVDGDWVAFDVTSASGETVRIEHKVVRIARIKRNGGPAARRATVVIGICLGDVYQLTEVNLTDRDRFKYPMLVGRSFLVNRFTVDPARSYTVEPGCKPARAR